MVAENQLLLDNFMFNLGGNILDKLLEIEWYPYFKGEKNIKKKEVRTGFWNRLWSSSWTWFWNQQNKF